MSYGEDVQEWVPLDGRESPADVRHSYPLVDGVPPWLRDSLWKWIETRLTYPWRNPQRVSRPGGEVPLYVDLDNVRRMERSLRFSVGWSGTEARHLAHGSPLLNLLKMQLGEDQLLALKAVDYLLAFPGRRGSPDAEALNVMLTEAGSEWQVGKYGEHAALTRRVAPATKYAAEQTIQEGGTAGSLLGDAWHAVFGVDPNPSAGYRSAVRAVEAAARPILTPNDPSPSLGKMIAAFRDKPEKWSFRFVVDSTTDPKGVLLGMMQLLWTNEYTRHVSSSDNTPLHVSQGEAEAAVILALTLVHWFQAGHVSPVPAPVANRPAKK